ncbi:glycogenin-2 isoform X4 [Narcine bancroftii]|uniref:glycogenin-2 isoform X4 n=1 Tax=Narcine bancroftii TaxID=1343680 RepID=UPI0038314001
MMIATDQAFVTLATNDAYCRGALVLCQSLKQRKTTRRVVVLFTPNVSSNMRNALKYLFDEAIEVNVLDSGDTAHLALLSRPELGVTFTKIHCWCLVQYSKCVFMDADTMVCDNIDDLFEREELSAAPDPGWPDCFNTGLFVYKPSIDTHNRLLQFAVENGSFDGGDQGLLNSFFRNWSTMDIHKHLPFIYNLASSTLYSYLPAFKQFGASVKVVHFLGPTKPWHHQYSVERKSIVEENVSPSNSMIINYLNDWWDIYTAFILPLLAQESGEKQEIHEAPRAGDHQVGRRQQEDDGATEEESLPTTPLEPQKAEPVIVGQLQTFSVQPIEHVAVGIPKICVQPPDSSRLLEPQIYIPPAKVRPQIVPILRARRKSALKTGRVGTSIEDKISKEKSDAILLSSPWTEEEKKTLSSESSTLQGKPVFVDHIGQQSTPFIAVPSTSTLEMVHKDIMASFLELSLDATPEDPDQAQERHRWEEGKVDYMGKDAFVNIQKKLDRFLK